MKKSKRYIKKEKKRELINKKTFQYIISKSNLCKHAIRELKLAGYGKGDGDIDDWMYKQVLEDIVVFSSHGNSGMSAPWEINLAKRLCNWDVLTPLKFTDDEWTTEYSLDDTCQNKRKSSVFKYPDGNIKYLDAFSKKVTRRYSYVTKIWINAEDNGSIWGGELYETKNGIMTGRHFRECFIKDEDVKKGWMPKDTIIINCNKIEISENNWIMTAEYNNPDLIRLSQEYNIEWLKSDILENIPEEEVTETLEKTALLNSYKIN